jgi:hypothetical protein
VTIGDRETLDGGRNTVAHSFRQLLDSRDLRTCNLFTANPALETSADCLRATSVNKRHKNQDLWGEPAIRTHCGGHNLTGYH